MCVKIWEKHRKCFKLSTPEYKKVFLDFACMPDYFWVMGGKGRKRTKDNCRGKRKLFSLQVCHKPCAMHREPENVSKKKSVCVSSLMATKSEPEEQDHSSVIFILVSRGREQVPTGFSGHKGKKSFQKH